MQTVNENIPATKVVKVSALRTVDHISDDAMFICVQNGKSLKTTYGALKEIMLKQVLNEVQQKISYQAKLEQAALSSTDEQLKANTNALSTAIVENMKKTNSSASALDSLAKNLDEVDDKTQKQISSMLGSFQKIGSAIEKLKDECTALSSNVDAKLKDRNKAFMKDFKQHKSDILQSIVDKEADHKKRFKDIDINFEKSKLELSRFKEKIDEENSSFNGRITEIKSDIQKRANEIDSKFLQVDSTFSEIGSKFDEVSNRFSNVNDKFTDINDKFEKNAASVDSNFASAKAQFSSIEKQISTLVKQIKLLENKIDNIVDDNIEFQKKVKDLVAYNDDAYCATIDEGDNK